MDIKLSSDFSIPIASLSVIDVIGVLVLFPINGQSRVPIVSQVQRPPEQVTTHWHRDGISYSQRGLYWNSRVI